MSCLCRVSYARYCAQLNLIIMKNKSSKEFYESFKDSIIVNIENGTATKRKFGYSNLLEVRCEESLTAQYIQKVDRYCEKLSFDKDVSVTLKKAGCRVHMVPVFDMEYRGVDDDKNSVYAINLTYAPVL